MNEADPKRKRYSEEEFALILRKAAELQPYGGEGSEEGRAAGLTIEEMRAIAREAGIDPEAVTRAASLLGALEWEEGEGLAVAVFGGPSKYHLEFEIPGHLPSDELGRILAEIRKTWEHQGEVTEVLGGFQWKTKGELSEVTVNITPRGDATFIQIVGDRGGAAAVTYVFPLAGAAVLVGALGGTLEPTSLAGIVSLVTGTLGAGFLTARSLWAVTSGKFRKKLTRLMDVLALSTERGARPPHTGPARPPQDDSDPSVGNDSDPAAGRRS